jgi:hypothetical protein
MGITENFKRLGAKPKTKLLFLGIYNMTKLKKIFLGLFLICSIAINFIHGNLFYDNSKQESNDSYWKGLLKEFPVPKEAIELELKFSFPSEDLAVQDILFNRPRCLDKDSKGNIYITDDGEHRVLKFDSSGNFLQKFGQKGQGPGDFLVPHNLFITKEDILIIGETGNMRFQFFNENGKYLKSFKIFKGYMSWVVGDNGLIFAIPVLRKGSNHLIEVLNQDGLVVSSFGEALNFEYGYANYNQANIEINAKGELYVAFRFLPIVRKYSQKGNLLSELRIDHEIMKEFEKFNLNNQSLIAKKERAKWKPVINMIRASENGFYIFHNFPRIEILEFNSDGNQIAHYWKEYFPYLAHYFIAHNDGNNKLFYVLQIYPEAKIDVFGPKH